MTQYSRWGQVLDYFLSTIVDGVETLEPKSATFIVQGKDDSYLDAGGVDASGMTMSFFSQATLGKGDKIVFNGQYFSVFKIRPQHQGLGYHYEAGTSQFKGYIV